jgi:hemerythrin-like domain-containing protein
VNIAMTDELTLDQADAPLSEHSRVLLAMHTAMRADARRLVHAATSLTDNDTARALGEAWALIVSLIHDHHWTEDDVMYPFLSERVPSFEIDAITLEDEHVELDAAMGRVSARLRLLSNVTSETLWRETHARLLVDAHTFDDVLVGHLDREEAVVVPAVDAMDAEAPHDLQRGEQRLATYRHMRMAMPWVLANLPDDEQRALRSLAPRLLGAVSDHVWDRRFQQVVEPLYRVSPHGS